MIPSLCLIFNVSTSPLMARVRDWGWGQVGGIGLYGVFNHEKTLKPDLQCYYSQTDFAVTQKSHIVNI